MSRKRFTEREVIATLLKQGVEITCFRCCTPIERATEVEREHLLELGLGGEDTPDNCAYSHKACHSKVTNGTKATAAGSSKHRIAKAKRIAKGKMAVKRTTIPTPGGGLIEWTLEEAKPKRKWPTRKMQSRPFQKVEIR